MLFRSRWNLLTWADHYLSNAANAKAMTIDLNDPVAVLLAALNGSNLFVSFRFAAIISIMDYRDIITIEPGKRSGQPCIRGLRMTVQDVLEYLAGGMTEEEILHEFPDLRHEDIRACLAFAADRERRLAVLPQYEVAV